MAASAQTTAPKRHRIPGIDERAQQRKRGQPRRRVRVEHLDAGEVLARLRSERGQIRVEAAARDDRAECPTPATPIATGDRAPEHRAGEAAADAIDQHAGEQRQRQHGVLRSKADRRGRRAARPARSCGPRRPSARAAGGDRRSASGCCRHQARPSAACAASAAARPGTSLIGRTAEIPDERTREGQRGRRKRPRDRACDRGCREISPASDARDQQAERQIERDHRHHGANQRQDRQRPRLDRRARHATAQRPHDRRAQLAQRDVERDSPAGAADASRRRSRAAPSAKLTESMSSRLETMNGRCASAKTSASTARAARQLATRQLTAQARRSSARAAGGAPR